MFCWTKKGKTSMVKKKYKKKLRLKSKFVPKKNSIGFTTQQFDATEATTIG